MIDPRRPNFDLSPVRRERVPDSTAAGAPIIRIVTPRCGENTEATLRNQTLRAFGADAPSAPYWALLAPGVELEPTALEKLAWYLHTHDDAAAVVPFHVAGGPTSMLATHATDDWRGALRSEHPCPMIMVRRDHLPAELAERVVKLSPHHALLSLAERGLSCGTIPEFLAWVTQEPERSSRNGPLPRLETGHFPAPPRMVAPAFETLREQPLYVSKISRQAPRALLIVPWFTMGGADKFNLRLMRQLKDRGWDLTVVATQQGDQSWLSDFTAITPDVFVLTHCIRPDAGPFFLRSMIESRQPSVVLISNSELGYLSLPYLRAHCPGPAYVDYSHMEEPRWKNGGWCRYGLGWQEQLDLNIVTSDHLKRWFIARGADPQRVEVCTINEDPTLWVTGPDERRRVRTSLKIEADMPVLLYAARICEQKQPHVFIATVRALRDRGLTFVAIVAGDGPDRHYLEEYAGKHGLGHCVRFLLAVPPADMPGVYAASDVLFLPSDREGIALVLFEAMAAGLAVVGAAVGGQPELVTPECGVLLPRLHDAAAETLAYANVLADLLNNPQRRREMGRAGKARIEQRFSLSHMGDRMTDLFDRARTFASHQPRQRLSPGLAKELATLGVEYLRADQQSSQPPPALAVPLRYRLADRLNLALKRIGLSAPLKRAMSRLAGHRA